MMKNRRTFFLVSGLILMIIAATYAYTQDRILWHDGHPYDADSYYQMALQVAEGRPISAEKPFVYRLATPTIVGKLFSGNIMEGFWTLNFLFGLGILWISALLFQRYFRAPWTVVIAIALIITNPEGPVRFSAFFPVFTDAGALFFIVAILFVGVSRQPIPWLVISLLSFVGVFFREVVMAAPLALLLGGLWRSFLTRDRHSFGLWLVLPVLSAAAGIAATHLIVESSGDYTFSSHALFSLSRHVQHPSILLAAPLTVYGPVILLLIVMLRQTATFISENPELVCYAGLIGVLSVFGGTHTDRFIFWAFPAVLPAFGVLMEKLFIDTKWSIRIGVTMFSLISCQALAFRAFQSIPNADFDALINPGRPALVLFAPYGKGINFAQLCSAYMSGTQRHIVLMEYGALLALLYILLQYKDDTRRRLS